MKTRGRISLLGYAIAALSLASCSGDHTAAESHSNDHSARWGYEADNGPANWGVMDDAWHVCADGREQSPIDLSNTTAMEMPAAVVDRPIQAGAASVINNGHTIQVNAKTGETLTAGDKTYALLQFHFHAPSEHTVDGEHFPMEMHFVHQADDGALAVVGVFVEEGAANAGIALLWERLSELSDTAVPVEIPTNFDGHVFPNVGTGFYHYGGSLTTPPCSEGVKWYVRKSPTQFSAGQIAAFTAIYDHNNRPVQPLNDRTLYQDD